MATSESAPDGLLYDTHTYIQAASYTLINQDYGFSPDALDSVQNFRDQLFAVANIKSNSEGVYNLPVCVLNELASIPECFRAFSDNGAKTPLTDDELDNCFIHPVNCLGGKHAHSPDRKPSAVLTMRTQTNLGSSQPRMRPTVFSISETISRTG